MQITALIVIFTAILLNSIWFKNFALTEYKSHFSLYRCIVNTDLPVTLHLKLWFVCLGLYAHSRMFHSFGTSPLPFKGCTQHSWPLISEGSLTCHTYCDTLHLFKIVISEDPWHPDFLPSVCQWICYYLF